jgi:molybdenum cofactor cytidylyltransferase
MDVVSGVTRDFKISRKGAKTRSWRQLAGGRAFPENEEQGDLARDKVEAPVTSFSGEAQAAPALAEIGLVVLAAGRSTRMGSPKALVEFEGRPLVEHLLTPPLVRQFGDVVVVLGHHAEALRPVVARLGYRHVVNPDPDRGRTGSVQIGLGMLASAIRAALVQPVDCPIVRPQTYVSLAAALGSADVVIPSHQGRRGHPPLVAARMFPRILAARPDEPLRDLLQAAEIDCRTIEVDDPGVLVNIDRPEDLTLLTSLRVALPVQELPHQAAGSTGQKASRSVP